MLMIFTEQLPLWLYWALEAGAALIVVAARIGQRVLITVGNAMMWVSDQFLKLAQSHGGWYW